MKYITFLAFASLVGTAQAQEKEKLPTCDPSISIGHTFAPKPQGSSDHFMPSFTGKLPATFEFIVYNRWGQKIFETKDAEQGWNGQLEKNDPAPAGTYFWVMKYAFAGTGEETCSGNLTLTR